MAPEPRARPEDIRAGVTIRRRCTVTQPGMPIFERVYTVLHVDGDDVDVVGDGDEAVDTMRLPVSYLTQQRHGFRCTVVAA